MTPTKDRKALLDIHVLLDGQEFSADTCEEIALILEHIGLPVRDVDMVDWNSECCPR